MATKDLDGRTLYPRYRRERNEANRLIADHWENLHETDMGVEGKFVPAESLIGLIQLVRLLEEEVMDLHKKIDAMNRRQRWY